MRLFIHPVYNPGDTKNYFITFNYELFLLSGLIFPHTVEMLCVGFRFRFAPVFGIFCPAALCVVGLKQPLQYVSLPLFDHPIV
jgi:hypothetical protein